MSKEEEIKVDILIELSDLVYLVNKKSNVKENVKKICKIVTKNEMLPYYKQYLTKVTNIKIDDLTLKRLEKENTKKLKELEDSIVDAKENLGESEVKEAYLNKSKYLHQIGNKEESIKSYKETIEKTVDLGKKIDLVFSIIRIGFGFGDIELIKNNIERSKKMIERGGDWERRNRLKIYRGVYLMKIRNFTTASSFLMDSISTFSCYEFMGFHQYIFYSVVMGIFTLSRPVLKKKIIDSSDILSVINKIPHIEKFLKTFYQCKYNEFLRTLLDIEDEMKKDQHLSAHVNYFSREMRIKAYKQFLTSYKSVTLKSMSDNFGVSVDFLDQDLAKFIATRRINCKIDKVKQIVNTTRSNLKNEGYMKLARKGDFILGRLQKLSRVVDL